MTALTRCTGTREDAAHQLWISHYTSAMPPEEGQVIAGQAVVFVTGRRRHGECVLAQHPRLPADALKVLGAAVCADSREYRQR